MGEGALKSGTEFSEDLASTSRRAIRELREELSGRVNEARQHLEENQERTRREGEELLRLVESSRSRREGNFAEQKEVTFFAKDVFAFNVRRSWTVWRGRCWTSWRTTRLGWQRNARGERRL